MEGLYKNEKRKKKKLNERYNINESSPARLYQSYDNISNKNVVNKNFSSFNNSKSNNFSLNSKKTKNLHKNQTFSSCCPCRSQCGICLCPYIHHCNLHHIHFHTIHIPHHHTCTRFNNAIINRKNANNKLSHDLLNKVSDLRKECRQFKEELHMAKNANKVENKYITQLENTINSRDKDYNLTINEDKRKGKSNRKERDKNDLEKKYQHMLSRSFEVLHSVSNKCEDKKGKMKGEVNYYLNKEPDYDELIETQKKWVDNLPDQYTIPKKLDSFNYNNNSTFSNTNEMINIKKLNEDTFEDNNNIYIYNDKDNDKYYNNANDFNKTGDNKNNINKSYNYIKNNKYYLNNNEIQYNIEDQKKSLAQIRQNYFQKYDKKIKQIDDIKIKPNRYFDLYSNSLNSNDYPQKENNNININNNDIYKRNNNNLDYKIINNKNYGNSIYSNDYKEFIFNDDNKRNKYNSDITDNNYNSEYINSNDIKNSRNNPIEIINQKKTPVFNNNDEFNSSIKKGTNKFNNNIDLTFKKQVNINDIKNQSSNKNDLNYSNNSKFNDINRKISFKNNNKNINNPKDDNQNNDYCINLFKNLDDNNNFMNKNNEQNEEIINYKESFQKLNNLNNINKKEISNPLNERYIIVDKNGDPIFVEGVRLFGMDIIPLIGEDGKEVIDDNGNIIILGPDGNPKNQDELEPILLDDDNPLVNHDNRPFLGINGIPLINGYGDPILGPGELYDRNNQVVIGVLGIVPKDNRGNPIKVIIDENNENINEKNIENLEEDDEEENNNIINNNLNDIKSNSKKYNNNDDKKNINENNNIYNSNDNFRDLNNRRNKKNSDKGEIRNNSNNKFFNNLNDYNNLKPLIGSNGRPVKDKDNNYILLDENNKPVKNTGITLLLDQKGNPVLNSQSKPILIDVEGKVINIQNNKKKKKKTNNNDKNSDKNSFNNSNKFAPNQKEKVFNKNKGNNSSQKQQPLYQKIIPIPKNNFSNNKQKEDDFKNDKKPLISEQNNKNKPKDNYYNLGINNNNQKFYRQRNIRDKRDKGQLNYSQCSIDSLRKINFMRNSDYKGACFACDVGCSVSRSGYSPMNYSPYNNLIRRRESTPLKNENKHEYERLSNTQNLKDGENDNNDYLTEV